MKFAAATRPLIFLKKKEDLAKKSVYNRFENFTNKENL